MPSLLLLLLVITSSLGFTVLGEPRYSKVFLFDSDNDGVLEIITDIGFVEDEALSPFPRRFDVYRFSCDYDMECVLLFDGYLGVAQIYGGGFVRELSIGDVLSVSNHPYNMLSVGGSVYWKGSFIRASLDAFNLKGFIYDGSIALAYLDRSTGYVVVEFPGRSFRKLIPFNGSLIGVGVRDDLVDVLLTSPTGSAYVEWSPKGFIRVNTYNVVLENVIAYSNGVFIANGDDGVYFIDGRRALLALEGYEAVKTGLGGEVLITGGGKIIVARMVGGGFDIVREFNINVTVVDVDYGGEILAYTDGLKVNVVTLKPVRPVELSIPDGVIAGEPVTITITGDFRMATLKLPDSLINLSEDNPQYTWRPLTPGTYIVTAFVDVGDSTVTLSKTITVAPRPAILTIKAPDSVKPYSSIGLVLEIRDGITRAPLRDVLGLCTVTASNTTYPIRPWTPVLIPAKPVGAEVPIVAYCRLPSPYSDASASIILRVSEPYVEVQTLYLGGGVVRFDARNMYTGEPVDGELRVMIDGNMSVIRTGGSIKLPEPGVWDVAWELVVGGVILASGTTTINYYESIIEAPSTVQLNVADRLITVTTRVPQPVEVPVTITSEVTRIDPLTALLSFIAGIALAGVPLVIILVRRAGGGGE